MDVKQTENLKFTKTDDLNQNGNIDESIDLSPFVGSWTNTKEGTGQLPKVVLRAEDKTLYMRAFAAGRDGMIDWGESVCEVFAENIYDGTAIAYITAFSFDEIDVEITANVKLGVLVVQTYTKFKDGSKRLNYYAREFYGPSQD